MTFNNREILATIPRYTNVDTEISPNSEGLYFDSELIALRERSVRGYVSHTGLVNPATREIIRISGQGTFSDSEATNEIVNIILDSEWLAQDNTVAVDGVRQIEKVFMAGGFNSSVTASPEIIRFQLDTEWRVTPASPETFTLYYVSSTNTNVVSGSGTSTTTRLNGYSRRAHTTFSSVTPVGTFMRIGSDGYWSGTTTNIVDSEATWTSADGNGLYYKQDDTDVWITMFRTTQPSVSIYTFVSTIDPTTLSYGDTLSSIRDSNSGILLTQGSIGINHFGYFTTNTLDGWVATNPERSIWQNLSGTNYQAGQDLDPVVYTFTFPHVSEDSEVVFTFTDTDLTAEQAILRMDTDVWNSTFTISVDTDTEYPALIINTNSSSNVTDATITSDGTGTNTDINSGQTRFSITQGQGNVAISEIVQLTLDSDWAVSPGSTEQFTLYSFGETSNANTVHYNETSANDNFGSSSFMNSYSVPRSDGQVGARWPVGTYDRLSTGGYWGRNGGANNQNPGQTGTNRAWVVDNDIPVYKLQGADIWINLWQITDSNTRAMIVNKNPTTAGSGTSWDTFRTGSNVVGLVHGLGGKLRSGENPIDEWYDNTLGLSSFQNSSHTVSGVTRSTNYMSGSSGTGSVTYRFSFPHLGSDSDSETSFTFTDTDLTAEQAILRMDTDTWDSAFTITIDTDAVHPTLTINTNSRSAADDSSLTVTGAGTRVQSGQGQTLYQVTQQGVDPTDLSMVTWLDSENGISYTEAVPHDTTLPEFLLSWPTNETIPNLTFAADTDSDALIATRVGFGPKAASQVSVNHGNGNGTFAFVTTQTLINQTFSYSTGGSDNLPVVNTGEWALRSTPHQIRQPFPSQWRDFNGNFVQFVTPLTEAQRSTDNITIRVSSPGSNRSATLTASYNSASPNANQWAGFITSVSDTEGAPVFGTNMRLTVTQTIDPVRLREAGVSGIDSEQLTYTINFPHLDTDALVLEFAKNTTAEPAAYQIANAIVNHHFGIQSDQVTVDTDGTRPTIRIDTNSGDTDIADMTIDVHNSSRSVNVLFRTDTEIVGAYGLGLDTTVFRSTSRLWGQGEFDDTDNTVHLFPASNISSGTEQAFGRGIVSDDEIDSDSLYRVTLYSHLNNTLYPKSQDVYGRDIDIGRVGSRVSDVFIYNWDSDNLPVNWTVLDNIATQGIRIENLSYGTRLDITDGFGGHPATTVQIGNFTYIAGHGGSDTELFNELRSNAQAINGWDIVEDTDSNLAVRLVADVAGTAGATHPSISVTHGTGNGTFAFNSIETIVDAVDSEFNTASNDFLAELMRRPVPKSSTDFGKAGNMAYADGYLYICIATNTWQRVQLSTW